jgi:hypothetical protein
MKTKPIRIIFKYKNKYYKFMNYIPSKKDNSFYFHIYQESFENLKILNIPLEKREDNKINFNDFVETNFKRNKLSFHQSGYIHSTDSKGNRFQDGVIGIPFDKIDKSLLIMILVPKKIDTLIEIEKINQKKIDVLINLPSDIKPFTLNFEIIRKSKISELDISITNLICPDLLITEYYDKKFGLRLYLKKAIGNAEWPPFNLIFKRIGNGHP